ncbi:recombination protein NinB [Novosphingobium lindaniclasticum]
MIGGNHPPEETPAPKVDGRVAIDTHVADLLHAMLSDISRAKPMGRNLKPEIWKCLFLDAMGHQANWVLSLDGDGVVNTGFRSSRLTVAEMSDMIESLYAFGAEHGVEWSEPAERHAA